MLYSCLLLSLAMFVFLFAHASVAADAPDIGPAALAGPVDGKPVKIILDTDMDSDCDDPGALGILHALADNGEAELLAVMVSSLGAYGPPCTDAINTYYGRPAIPIGQARAPAPDQKSRYAKGVAEKCPHDLKPGEAPDAVALYHDVLKSQPDRSVVLVTVGDMTNLAKLLKSDGGEAIVQQKVRVWICMGGNFIGSPAKDDLKLGNNNFTLDPKSTFDAITHWPTPIVFAGREVCSVPSGVVAGAVLKDVPADHPVRLGYELYFGGEAKDRHVADLATVLFAVRGLGENWSAHGTGSMNLKPDMTFEWDENGTRPQAYLLKRTGPDGKPNDRDIEKQIDALLVQPPKAKSAAIQP